MIERDDKKFSVEERPAARYSRGIFTDIHCHCLPAIDDGPATMKESLELCSALERDRVKTVIATAHQLGRYDKTNTAAKIREKVEMLNVELEKDKIPVRIMPGADVRIDERICQMIEDDEVLTAADNKKYIMLEQASEVLIDINPLITQLSRMGIKAIISHPERQLLLMSHPQMLYKWKEEGVCMQITAGSLLGRFGAVAQKGAWQLLSSGGVIIAASDSHNTSSRPPCMRAAYELIRTRLGEAAANIVCIENPQRVIDGKELLNIPVQDKRGFNEQIPNRLRNYARLLRQT
jgi:protein-tyrosine phosphatase